MLRVSNYRDRPQDGPTIAERVWTAWWKGAGQPLSAVLDHMPPMLDPTSLPLALVAHDADGYAGSAFLIECDLEERPQLKPWIAALWVERAKRGQGIAAMLMGEARERAAMLGFDTAYLCCRADLETFYTARGWMVMERGVGAHDLSVLAHPLREA